jgi:predicted RNase H-like HicB family nuclease
VDAPHESAISGHQHQLFGLNIFIFTVKLLYNQTFRRVNIFLNQGKPLCPEEGKLKFLITIFQDQDEDGMYVAECPAIPGCVSQGQTEEEAEQNIHQAIKECLEVRAEQGLPLTVPTRQIEVEVEWGQSPY